MVKVVIEYTNMPPVEFDSSDIAELQNIEYESFRNLIIKLKDGRNIILPLSKEDFESMLQKGEDIKISIDL